MKTSTKLKNELAKKYRNSHYIASHLLCFPLNAENRLARHINGLGNRDNNPFTTKLECRGEDIKNVRYSVYPDVVNIDLYINWGSYGDYPVCTFALVYNQKNGDKSTQFSLRRAWYFAYRNYRRIQNANQDRGKYQTFQQGIKREFRVETWSEKI